MVLVGLNGLTINMCLTRYRYILLAPCKDENGEMILSLLPVHHVKKLYHKTCHDLLSYYIFLMVS